MRAKNKIGISEFISNHNEVEGFISGFPWVVQHVVYP